LSDSWTEGDLKGRGFKPRRKALKSERRSGVQEFIRHLEAKPGKGTNLFVPSKSLKMSGALAPEAASDFGWRSASALR
jgi:hypothetical protein